MPEPSLPLSAVAAQPAVLRETTPSGPRLFVAALLSAMLPGVGHFLARRSRKGFLLLLVVGVWFAGYCWLRLPRTVYGAFIPIFGLIGLCVFATWDVAFSGRKPETKPSQWWLAALLPVALYGANVLTNLALRAAGFQVFSMPSASMLPAIPQGSTVMADRRYYVNRKVQHGDIIIFTSPNNPKLLLAKRAIAVGGETIKVEREKVQVNGEWIVEPYTVFKASSSDLPWVAPTILPPDKLFVMGDNRSMSFDSRYEEFGLVDLNAVRGKVIYMLPTIHSDLKTF